MLVLSAALAWLAPAAGAETMTAPRPVIDLDLPTLPRVDLHPVTRPAAEQGQIRFHHRSTSARLADADLERALGSLAPGTRIRIGSPGGDPTLTGTYMGMGPFAVRVETVRGPVAFDRAAVRGLWVGRAQTGKGAVIGGINGFLLGMLMGAVSLEGSPGYTSDHLAGFAPPPGRSDLEQFGQLCFRWGLPVGLAGAALGAVIGSFATGWQPVSP